MPISVALPAQSPSGKYGMLNTSSKDASGNGSRVFTGGRGCQYSGEVCNRHSWQSVNPDNVAETERRGLQGNDLIVESVDV